MRLLVAGLMNYATYLIQTSHTQDTNKPMLQLILWAGLIAALYYFICVKPVRYWHNRGVQQTNPRWLLGDNWGILLGNESTSSLVSRCYNQFPGARYFGWYQFASPTLMIKDPELIKQIAIKDFDHFTDHRPVFPENSEPLWNKNLFALTGNKWRQMRPILSPNFTSSKMKMMFKLISECSENFVTYFQEKCSDCTEVEMKNIFTRFTNDVIATTAFGVEVDSLKNPNNEFYLKGKEASDFSGFWRMLKIFGYFLIPRIYHILHIHVSLFPKSVSVFFSELVESTIKIREEKNIIRTDMIYLLMEAKKGKKQKEEKVVETGFATAKEVFIGEENASSKITNADITAQVLIFFFAGFDSVSTLMCFMSYELAVNADVQNRLRHEIKETIADCRGKLTYEVLMKMKYMDMVVSETLRKWPPSVVTDRMCTKPYTINPTNSGEEPVHLEKNSYISFPIFAIHRDPKYYPEPERFDPERFSEENAASIRPYSFIPFGTGPRNCIGSRFALLETKVIFFHLLANFELQPVKKTTIHMRTSEKGFNLLAEDGVWVGLKKLTK